MKVTLGKGSRLVFHNRVGNARNVLAWAGGEFLSGQPYELI